MSEQQNIGYQTDEQWNLYDWNWNFLAYNWQYQVDELWNVQIFQSENAQNNEQNFEQNNQGNYQNNEQNYSQNYTENTQNYSQIDSPLANDSLNDYWIDTWNSAVQLKNKKEANIFEKIIGTFSWLFKKKEFSWEVPVSKDIAVMTKKRWWEIKYEDKFPSELSLKEDVKRFVYNVKNIDKFFKGSEDKVWNVSKFKLFFIWKVDIVDFLDQLSTLINAWIRLVDSILILKSQSKNSSMKLLLGSIAEKMWNWQHLSEAMEDYESIFPKKWVKLILAAEKSWKMSEVLKNLSEEELSQMQFISKVKWAMIYPSILLIMAGLVFWLMMTKMVPALENAFGSTDQFPELTLKIIALSHYMQENFFMILLVPTWVFLFLFFINSQFITSQIFWNHIWLNVPIFWKISRRKNLIIFSDNFALLLSSWVLVTESLKIVAQIMPSVLFRRELHIIRHWVENGKSISIMMGLLWDVDLDNIKENKYFPLEVAQMIKIWEETWNTIDILKKISEVNWNKLDNIIKNLTAMLEPLITVVIWAIVWTMLLAFMIPMMSSFKAV